MEKENKFRSITNKCYDDVTEYFGKDYEDKCLVIIGKEGDECSTALIGKGGTIVNALVNAMLNNETFAQLVQYAVKEYKIASIAKNVNPDTIKNIIDKMKELFEEKENNDKDQEGK